MLFHRDYAGLDFQDIRHLDERSRSTEAVSWQNASRCGVPPRLHRSVIVSNVTDVPSQHCISTINDSDMLKQSRCGGTHLLAYARIHRSFALLPSAFSASTFSRQIYFQPISFPAIYKNPHLLMTFLHSPWRTRVSPRRTHVSSKARCLCTMVAEG